MRMIDADALMDVIRQHEYPLATKQGSLDYGMFTLGIQQAVDEQHTVDVEPVVHGHWVKYIFLGHDQFVCSECQTIGSPQWKRCPVCEAKMDGGNEDG